MGIGEFYLCDVLGVEVGERFNVRFSRSDVGYSYYVSEDGDLLNVLGNQCNEVALGIINGKYEMIRVPQIDDVGSEILGAIRIIKEYCYHKDCSSCSLKTPIHTCEVRNLGKYIPYGGGKIE